MQVQSIEELLEQEEHNANLRIEEARRQQQLEAENRSSDPRREGRNGRNGTHRDINRYSAEREENDERRARKSRDLGDDDGNGSPSEKGSANGSIRSRRRSRSPDSYRHSPRDRDGYRERDRGGDFYRANGSRRPVDRDSDYYRPGDRRRRDDDRPPTRERDDRRGPRDSRADDRHRSDYDRRDPNYDRRDPRFRRSPPRKKTPEPTDDERDKRTVFVQQLAARLRTRDMTEFFSQVGAVKDAQIVKDRVSGRSKGVGYVEFKEEESVQKAIQLTGQKLLGIPVIVQLTEAEKNRQARNSEGTHATQSNGIPFHRLYVGNIHFSITENDLKDVFEPFGDLEFVQLQKEDQGRSKGYGFVQFVDPAQAKEALDKMNGFELANRPIRVGLGNDKFTPESTQNLLRTFGSHHQQAQGSAFSGMGGRGAHAGGTGNFDRAGGRDADKTGGASALDDTDVAGVNFSNYSRDSLMRKLARQDDTEQPTQPLRQQARPAPIAEQAPTRCVIVKHMYRKDEMNEPSKRKALEDETRDECNDSYGQTVHIGIPPSSDEGEVYIKFKEVAGGKNAVRGLNGRFFDGNMVTAQYIVDAVYHASFPRAASL